MHCIIVVLFKIKLHSALWGKNPQKSKMENTEKAEMMCNSEKLKVKHERPVNAEISF